MDLMGDVLNDEQCFSVTLLTDSILELTEDFIIELASNDTAFNITQTSAQVMIQDNTG